MVHQKLVSILIGLLFTQSLFASGFSLYLPKKEMSSECENLTIQFLKELKNISNDGPIEIVNKKENSEVSLNCKIDDSKRGIELRDSNNLNDPVFVRYLNANAGFDSIDWLQVQRRYLQNENTPAIAENRIDENKLSAVVKAESTGRREDQNRKIVWYSLAGATAGAIGGGLFSPNSESTVANIAVFGLLGAATGAAFGCIRF